MRRIEKIMKDWKFWSQHGETFSLDLPHTWNEKDGQSGGNNYYRGTSIYEKGFVKPEFTEEEEVYLQFHGVNASARVMLNEKEMCVHNNGYSTFRVNITKELKENNILRVEVDNGVNDKVYPQKADFTFYGGIYRDVELLIVAKNHFELDYFGGQGIQVSTQVKENTGIIHIRTYTNVDKTENVEKTKKLKETELRIDLEVKEADGTIVGIGKGTNASIEIPNVHLWNGIHDPYLYTITARLADKDKVWDEVQCKCGVRTFSVDSNKGFFLNGKSYPLRGVSRHQDWKDIGNAISQEQMEEDMALIREIGANTIRLAHYQHDQYFYDLCDQYGMVVWAEIPYISAHMPNARDNTFLQMKELIIQNYNHPCIVTWGISNEITISGRHRKDMLDNHQALQTFVKKLDPTRLTTLACFAMCSPFHPVTKISDIVGWNLYLGWYVPGLFLNDLFFKFYHFMYPKRCLGYSEYGAEGMANLHSERPRRGDHSEEYQAKYHEYMLNCFARYPFLWSTYVWNMFDFAADARNQGGEPGMNHKGLVTFNRKTKKDSFYIYKAWWSKEPFVHLCGKRFEYRSEKVANITVYSNQKEVTLFHNGKQVETKKGEHAFHFKVVLEETNQLEVKSGNLKDIATIYKSAKPKKEYKVKKGKSQNWV